MIYKLLLIFGICLTTGKANECIPRSFDSDSIVCVCNATYCDDVPKQNPVIAEDGFFYQYTSSKDGLRMKFNKGSFQPSETLTPRKISCYVNREETYQKIFGFGAAITDSAGLNIRKLSKPAQKLLIESYFSQEGGSRYEMCRVPIGGTDFSTRPYSLDDVPGDVSLSHFNLTFEDLHYKIPYIQEALKLHPGLKIMAAAWSAPAWMKSNNNVSGLGFLKVEYYPTHAKYILKFLEAYESYGIKTWAVSTNNEPNNCFFPAVRFNKMCLPPSIAADWVADHLGPAIKNSRYNDTFIVAMDDQRIFLPGYPDIMFENKIARKFVDMIAVHWYTDDFASTRRLDQTHKNHPDKPILMTEACTGSMPYEYPKVILGSWKRGEQYILSIIEYLEHWTTSWIDWNIALDVLGGPNWVKNNVDSPIIVSDHTDEFYKQPMYYAIKHFSRFIEPKSVRIGINCTSDIKVLAFKTPSGEIVIVLYNRKSKPESVSINDPHKGIIQVDMKPYSIETIVYKN